MFIHTYQDIISTENLLEAWKEFIKDKRSRKDAQEFSLRLMDNIISLHQDLAAKTYRHGAYEAFNISDPKPMIIHKASVTICNFHRTLKIAAEGEDIMWLLSQVVESFNAKDKIGVGLPLGNLTSQLFSNIYLNELYQFVKHKLKTRYYIRYADDFVFFTESKQQAEELIPKINNFLQTELKLNLHSDKVFIKTLSSSIDFLGWVNFFDHRVLRTATKKRMFNKIGESDKPETVISYLGMLSHGDAHKLKRQISVNL